VAVLRHLRGSVVRVRFGEVDAFSLLHLEDADPLHLRVPRLVVLLHARVDAPPAADAARDVEGIGELDPRQRLRIGHRHGLAVLLRVAALHFADGVLQAIGWHFVEAAGSAAGQRKPAAAAAAHVANWRRLSVVPGEPGFMAPLRAASLDGPRGPHGRGHRLNGLEPGLVRIVAVRAQQVRLVAVPLARPPPVDAGAPVAQFLAVALPHST